jgi:stage II sporulation protein M
MLNKLYSLILKEINLLKNIWKQSRKAFWRYWLVVFITIIVAYLATYLTLHFLNIDIKKLFSEFGKVSKLDHVATDKDNYWQGTIHLFKNNWIVCLQIFGLSFIPIPFLYNISLIVSSVALGVVIGLAQKVGMNLFSTIVLGVLPHSILELSLFIITALYAGKINQIIIRKLMNKLRRKKKAVPLLWEHLKETFIVFLIVITPFIFIAAFIEGYITRFLLNLN